MPTTPQTMTYNSLQEDLRRYLERGSEEDEMVNLQMPRIIGNCQRTLSEKLKILGYVGAFTSKMKVGEPRIAKPNNWRSTISINFGLEPDNNSRQTLRPCSYEYLRALFPDDRDLGAPVYYADYDLDHWIVQPTPAYKYPFEAMVYRLPDLLSEQNQENFLTKYVPNLLLYTCLVAFEPFVKNESRMQTWQTLATDEFEAVNTEDLRRMVDRSMTRSTT